MKKLIMLLLCIFGVFALVACSRGPDVFDYLEVEFSGFDTVGRARVNLDDGALEYTLFGEDESLMREMFIFFDGLRIDVSDETGLSNGDSITVSVTVPDGSDARGGERTFTVEGLEEPSEIDDDRLTEFFHVTFDGMNGFGYAEVASDPVFSANAEVLVPESGELANGDAFIIQVNDISLLYEGIILTGTGRASFVVSGLTELNVLTVQDIQNNMTLVFTGTSGRGEATITTSFGSELDRVDFEVQNNGALTNGEEAIVVLGENGMEQLRDMGYAFPDNEQIVFITEGLHNVARIGEEIANLEDVMRVLMEELSRQYANDYEYEDRENTARVGARVFGNRYEIEIETVYYRDLARDDGLDIMLGPGLFPEPINLDGTLIAIFTVREFHKWPSEVEEFEREFILAFGFVSMFIDDANVVNVAALTTASREFDVTYSLMSVRQMAEGLGYVEVMIVD